MTSSDKPTTVRLIRLACIALGFILWFLTQWMIGQRPFPGEDPDATGRVLTAADALHQATSHWNRALHENETASRALLIFSSGVIDIMGTGLILLALLGNSIRPFLGLLFLFTSRQVCQYLCPLPAPEGIIWNAPGFPSLLVTYGVANDFFFSGHTAIAVFAGVELGRQAGTRGWLLGGAIIFFEVATVLVLRAHYTIDVIAAIGFALAAHPLADSCAGPADHMIRRLAGHRDRQVDA